MRAFLLCFFLLCSGKITGFSVPSFTQPVIDQASILNNKTVQELNQALSDLYESGGPQIAVLTISSLENQTLETASLEVVNKWKLGAKKKDNGVLILIAKKEKKIRIEVGYGLEADIPDAYAKRIIEDVMVPQFRQGNFNVGVLSGVEQIAQMTRCKLPKVSRPKEKEWIRLFEFLGWGFYLTLLFYYRRKLNQERIKRKPKPWYDGWDSLETRNDISNFLLYGGGNGPGGGRGGGGGFGGGGASGGW